RRTERSPCAPTLAARTARSISIESAEKRLRGEVPRPASLSSRDAHDHRRTRHNTHFASQTMALIFPIRHGDVLVSERLGPAIFGLVRPCIVVPSWLFETAPEQQALVLRHEREHAAARDPLLLAAALLMVAL